MFLSPDSTQRTGESIVKEIVLSLCTGIHCDDHRSYEVKQQFTNDYPVCGQEAFFRTKETLIARKGMIGWNSQRHFIYRLSVVRGQICLVARSSQL